MYRHNEPHGVETSTVPTARTHQIKQLTTKRAMPALKNGIEKLNLINEALARARMRDLWRHEHRHKRRAYQIIADVHRKERSR
ncbi:MAG TPA: hypothetical protein VE172_09860 [Stackebrandtia sp.]|jgi:hypothetical protein|uniref:hypothetical protein n=1 Tax=Stackebrandtia sp. TaxID=2023065 RepID=UPI002D53C8D8|nr:hypothetical protein [Stackebrandtia sp.]HZE39101.1 hypothetical protein [Stackebrandtia sp.]